MNFSHQLLMPLQFLLWSAVFYITHSILIAISIIPAAIRAAQMLKNKYLSSHLLEALAGISRVVLVFMIIAVSAPSGIAGVLSGQALAESFYQSFQYIKSGWPGILLQLVLFALVFVLINLLIYVVGRVSSAKLANGPEAGNRELTPGGKAVLFVIKNTLVIPISMIYLFRVLRII